MFYPPFLRQLSRVWKMSLPNSSHVLFHKSQDLPISAFRLQVQGSLSEFPTLPAFLFSSSASFHILSVRFTYVTCMSVLLACIYIYICSPCACLVPTVVRRGLIPWNWSCKLPCGFSGLLEPPVLSLQPLIFLFVC